MKILGSDVALYLPACVRGTRERYARELHAGVCSQTLQADVTGRLSHSGVMRPSARRGKMLIRLRRRCLAGGENTLQVPLAEWTAGCDRVDDAAKRYALGIGTRSHIDLLIALEIKRDFFRLGISCAGSDVSTKMKFACASFRFASIDFSSSSSASVRSVCSLE
jgi:hypothetical protein